MLLFVLLTLVIFSFGYCVDGSCIDTEQFNGGCSSCGDVSMIESLKNKKDGGGKGGKGGHKDGGDKGGKSNDVKPSDGKQHSAAVPMQLNKKDVIPAHNKRQNQQHIPASKNGENAYDNWLQKYKEKQQKEAAAGAGNAGNAGNANNANNANKEYDQALARRDAVIAGAGAGKNPNGRGSLADNKYEQALEHNKALEKRGVAMPSQSGLMGNDDENSPVTININYNSEVDSDNVEKNSNNKKFEMQDIMREIGKRNVYPGNGGISNDYDGDAGNCSDNRTYNGYCNKGAYQVAQMQREILNLKKKYSQLAYLNDNPYMPLNQEGKRNSVCPLEASGQFASFEGLKRMAQDEPMVNPMMAGIENRWHGRGGNNEPREDYIPT